MYLVVFVNSVTKENELGNLLIFAGVSRFPILPCLLPAGWALPSVERCTRGAPKTLPPLDTLATKHQAKTYEGSVGCNAAAG